MTNGFRPVELSIPVTTDFVPVFVFCANLYTSPGSIFIVITSSLVVTSSIIALHSPVTIDRAMIPIVSIVHPPHAVLIRAPLIHSPHPIGIALLHSPIATHPDIVR